MVAHAPAHRFAVRAACAVLPTGTTPPTSEFLVENFDNVLHLDRTSTAPWDLANSGRLESGTGIGGSGIDGIFPPAGSGTAIVLDTTANGGAFQFTSFSIPSGTTVNVTGPNPLRVRSIGDVTIDGVIHGDGQAGLPGLGNDVSIRQGGAGGQANGTPPSSVTDVAYASAVDPRITVQFRFAGAQPKTTNPNEADPATDTGFVTDVAQLTGYPFIRFRVAFATGVRLGDLPSAAVDSLRIRFQYP
ncbi:MAG: hypothetical protein HYR85_24935 [Planctomycetes bacterium]|nr:hypothetical protein [Planctomycetota bacterium]MBI3844070.1 hypothetical protein [Planctomycetota bacterium]